MSKTLPEFLTAYGSRKNCYSPHGEIMEKTYGYVINKHGQKVLEVTGETNVYAKIQEYAEETKIENILARVAAGDNTVFRPDGMYEDITEAPKNLIEARKMMQKLEDTWTGLPQNIREKYDNDVEKFIGAAGNETWLKDMGIIPTETPKEISKEITTEVKEQTNNES